MISKLIRPAILVPKNVLLKRKIKVPYKLLLRKSGDILPPSQYDMPLPKKLRIMHVLTVYWETIPLFIVTVIALGVCASSIAWACKNKVDVVFTTHSRRNISRTMNLRDPSIHKIIIINQRYEPWPEMQDVLDKMVMAEKRALVRMESCSHA